MAFAWKAAGITYNRYLAIAARVVRRSLKEGPRLQAERRGEMDLRFAKWQIGDRKMDSGALEPGETLDEDFDIEEDFLPEELIWLMDEMLNREEEDFTTQLFNRELLHRFSAESISDIATEAIEALEESDLDLNQQSAISARLNFRNDVLETLMQHSIGQTPPSSLFSFIHDSLKETQNTHHLGVVVPGAFSTKLQRRLASTVPPRPMVTVSMDEAWNFWHQMLDDCKNVFSVQQATHGQDLITAYQIFAYSSPQPSTYPRALLQLFLNFEGRVANRNEPVYFLEEDLQSLTLPASQLLTISDNACGRLHNGNQQVADCMRRFVDQFEQTFINVYRALCLNSCRIRRTFCHALVEWDVLQGQVEELDSTIQEALHERPTQYLPGSPPTYAFSLSSWVYHHKLNLLRLTIQMGFDQMIYAPHEMAGMYWYLSTVCDIHLSHLERISHFVTVKDTEMKRSSMNAGSKSKAAGECKAALDRLYRQYAWVKATQLLAGTLHGIFVVLQRHGVFVRQGPLYSSDLLRYEIRMKPFHPLSIPLPPTAEDFATQTDVPDLTTEKLLDQATTMAASAKKAWEEVSRTSWNVFPKGEEALVLDEKWNADVKSCLKAAIAAGLSVLTLKKANNNEEWRARARKEARLPGLEEKGRWHPWWIVPQLPAA
ncbi:N-alpha-acetyltransferase, non-catalitic subunit [Knufia obscura]|uniref:N-alpha-acetyltransferase, non-catalitic subunit n=1 Tax=Knufia obscura TaxID=1635080 RepID=A0ABR0RBF1_9EURO|nr:N-alpha-acetyltransferase, non-catalitic subunit [Knufia obscura]